MNIRTALRMALLIWIGSLFALLGMQRFFFEPLATMTATIAVFVGQVAPLLIVAPATLRSGARGPLWVCLAMLLYVVHGIWQWSSPNMRLFGILEVTFALGSFVTAWILLRVMPKDSANP
jgi:uncharacterized membrane protein